MKHSDLVEKGIEIKNRGAFKQTTLKLHRISRKFVIMGLPLFVVFHY
jgi:hypothetical protein